MCIYKILTLIILRRKQLFVLPSPVAVHGPGDLFVGECESAGVGVEIGLAVDSVAGSVDEAPLIAASMHHTAAASATLSKTTVVGGARGR